MTKIKTRSGVELYVKDWGQGRPVILLHGWPLTSDTWDDFAMEAANSGFRAISYDRRGFGRSDQPWTGYDLIRLPMTLLTLSRRPVPKMRRCLASRWVAGKWRATCRATAARM